VYIHVLQILNGGLVVHIRSSLLMCLTTLTRWQGNSWKSNAMYCTCRIPMTPSRLCTDADRIWSTCMHSVKPPGPAAESELLRHVYIELNKTAEFVSASHHTVVCLARWTPASDHWVGSGLVHPSTGLCLIRNADGVCACHRKWRQNNTSTGAHTPRNSLYASTEWSIFLAARHRLFVFRSIHSS